MNKGKISSYLDQINIYSKRLEKNIPNTLKEYESSLILKGFCERNLQMLIETCIDLANFIVKEERLGLPAEEENIFEKLKEAEILSEEMTKTLKEMKRFRNVLIHRYAEVKDKLVYEYATKRLHDFHNFKREILDFLQKQK